MMQLFGQMMMMPFSMLSWGMSLLASGLRSVQPPGWQGPGASDRYGYAPGTGFPEAGSHRDNQRAQGVGANEAKEERAMSDCGCHDHNHREVKLVEYTIVSIKRCDERIIAKGQEIYSDDMSDEAFATWVLARYLQGDQEGVYYRHEKSKIEADEKKYLRVYHHVLESWPRPEKDCCDDREVNVLRDIERAIRDLTGSRREEAAATA